MYNEIHIKENADRMPNSHSSTPTLQPTLDTTTTTDGSDDVHQFDRPSSANRRQHSDGAVPDEHAHDAHASAIHTARSHPVLTSMDLDSPAIPGLTLSGLGRLGSYGIRSPAAPHIAQHLRDHQSRTTSSDLLPPPASRNVSSGAPVSGSQAVIADAVENSRNHSKVSSSVLNAATASARKDSVTHQAVLERLTSDAHNMPRASITHPTSPTQSHCHASHDDNLDQYAADQSATTQHQRPSAPHSLMKYDHKADYKYNRVHIDYAPHAVLPEHVIVTQALKKCLQLRKRFVYRSPKRDTTQYDIHEATNYQLPPPSADCSKWQASNHLYTSQYVHGVYQITEQIPDDSAAHQIEVPLNQRDANGTTRNTTDAAPCKTRRLGDCPDRTDFSAAFAHVLSTAAAGESMSYCHNRLQILEARFNLHTLLNADLETLQQKAVPHRDFYNCRKIDNHVHHSAAMNQKHLLRYIKHKLKHCGKEIAIVRDGKQLTLHEVFDSLHLTPYDLNVDTLDMHADRTFHRFDRFNLKYNPVGESRLREIFLKYNNLQKGKYLAEVTKQVFDDLESNKYQFAEYRISIYGTSKSEWTALADWVVDNNLFHYNVRWMIQIPRLYRVYKASGKIQNFSQLLENIFEPLVQVSTNPGSNPKLHQLLQQVVGFDMVDDESQRERAYNSTMPPPEEWVALDDPPYVYYTYYMYANLYNISALREQRGLNTFAFRPHAGEAGDIEHLAATFLCCHAINHGLQLMKTPPLQYLYYLAQLPISMSPLSNNVLFLEYNKNPFPRYFARGLHVTLSTDDPLQIHVTKEPLVEEYSVASQVWKLTAIDVAEMARNSVLHSGWEHQYKARFIGNNYWLRSVDGNDIRQTNVPDLRIQFRCELLQDEHELMARSCGDTEWDESLIDPA